jgi:hypothetical protein
MPPEGSRSGSEASAVDDSLRFQRQTLKSLASNTSMVPFTALLRTLVRYAG